MCEASGVPEPQIKWIHNGLPIEQAPFNARRKVMQNKIVIERLVKNDTGNYGCNATNSLGYVYKDVYVNVLGKFYFCNILNVLLLLICFCNNLLMLEGKFSKLTQTFFLKL